MPFQLIKVHSSPLDAVNKAHAIAVLTEWDEFKTYYTISTTKLFIKLYGYNWEKIYEKMYKPAFVFDGRNILDRNKLEKIGFQLKNIGKG